jgi:hypothetical protein
MVPPGGWSLVDNKRNTHTWFYKHGVRAYDRGMAGLKLQSTWKSGLKLQPENFSQPRICTNSFARSGLLVIESGYWVSFWIGSDRFGDISERIQKTIEPEIYFEFPTTADVFSGPLNRTRRIPEFGHPSTEIPKQEYRKAPFLLSA